MGTSELVEKIRNDGRARIASIAAERENSVREVKSRSAAEVAGIESVSRKTTRRECDAIVERARSRARLELRNAVLAARWRVLERARELAEKRVAADPQYPDMVVQLVKKHSRPESEIRLSEADTRLLGSRLGGKLGKPVPTAGGVVIQTGREALDFSLTGSLRALSEALAPELAKVLFGQ